MSFNSLTERSGVITPLTPLTPKIEQVKPLINFSKTMNIYLSFTLFGYTTSLNISLNIRK